MSLAWIINYHKRRKIKLCGVCGNYFLGKDKQKFCGNHRHYIKKKERVCRFCQSIYFKKRKFCSRECSVNFLKKKIKINCNFCEKEIERQPSLIRKNNFCSRVCSSNFKIGKANKKIRGRLHPQWKGGLKRRRKTSTISYQKWRRSVYKRDKFTCQRCLKVGGRLVAHHIVKWSVDKKKRFLVSNGMTLCKDCHLKEHNYNFRI